MVISETGNMLLCNFISSETLQLKFLTLQVCIWLLYSSEPDELMLNRPQKVNISGSRNAGSLIVTLFS